MQHLLPALAAEQPGSEKWESLNNALISLIEEFSLVGFETLAVEDRQSMASLLRAIDRASGFIFAGARATDEEGRTLDDEASIWAQAMNERWVGKMDVRDVQERWIERKDEFDEVERKEWEEEARLAGALPEQSAAAVVRRQDQPTRDVDMDGDETDLMAEQRRWEQRREDSGGGTRVVRKG